MERGDHRGWQDYRGHQGNRVSQEIMVLRERGDLKGTEESQASLSWDLLVQKGPWADRDLLVHLDPRGHQGQGHLW